MIYTFFIPLNPFLFHPHPTHFYPIRLFFSSNFHADRSTNSLCIVGNDKAFITEWTFLMCDDLIIHVSHLCYCLVIIWQIYSDILTQWKWWRRFEKKAYQIWMNWTLQQNFFGDYFLFSFFSGLNKKSLLLWKRRMKQFSFPWLCSHNNYQNWQWQHFNIAILTTHHALSHHFRKCQLPLF